MWIRQNSVFGTSQKLTEKRNDRAPLHGIRSLPYLCSLCFLLFASEWLRPPDYWLAIWRGETSRQTPSLVLRA